MVYDAIGRYLGEKAAANLRPASVRLYRHTLCRFADFLRRHSVCSLDVIAPEHVSSHLAALLSSGIADTSVFTRRAIILGFLDWLTRTRQIPKQEWRELVPTVRTNHKEARWLTEDQVSHLVYVCRNVVPFREELTRRRTIAALAVLVDTGCRLGELLRLKVGDVRLDDCAMRISEETKGRAERMVWYGRTTRNMLRHYLEIHPRPTEGEWLWLSRTGRNVAGNTVHMLITRIADVAGLGHVTAHTLRHSCGSLLANAGLPLTDVQRILGHKRLSTTQGYLHTRDSDIAKRYRAASPLDRLTSES